jgi:hypothetical protein
MQLLQCSPRNTIYWTVSCVLAVRVPQADQTGNLLRPSQEFSFQHPTARHHTSFADLQHSNIHKEFCYLHPVARGASQAGDFRSLQLKIRRFLTRKIIL